MGRVDGKVALVTGSARGIGRGIAEQLAAEGANVIIADVLIEVAEQTAAEIQGQSGSDTLALAMDVTSEASIEEAIESARGPLWQD